MEHTYRGVTVRADFRLTSQNPGEGHSVSGISSKTQRPSPQPPAMRHDYVERRIARELKISQKAATQLFLDLQKFLWMAAQTPEPCIPSPLIDDAWHEFLLCTREYQAFCEEFCGGFVHHEPHTGDTSQPVDPLILHPTVDLMHATFGGKLNTNWDYVPSKEAVPVAA